MKKIIAVLLSVLMLFSTVSAVCFAADETEEPMTYYTITFVDHDGTVLGTRKIVEGGIIDAPENPVRANTKEVEYTFKGWSADGGKNTYAPKTLPRATGDITYTAIYAEERLDADNGLTFWKLIQSIFARINMIFEYFFNIFEKGPEKK